MKNQCHIIAEVTGSSPVPPTIASVLGQDLPLSIVLEALLGPDGKRRLRLRHMQNEELFKLYDSELALRLHVGYPLQRHYEPSPAFYYLDIGEARLKSLSERNMIAQKAKLCSLGISKVTRGFLLT